MPSLQKITVRGFKSIRELEALELRPLNVLIGPNGGGKSNFIELFHMLESISRGDLELFLATHGGPSDLLFHGKDERSLSVEAKLKFGALSYRCTLVPSGNIFVFQNESIVDDLPLDKPMSVHHATPEILGESTATVIAKSGHSESALTHPHPSSDNAVLMHARKALDGFRLFQFHDTLKTAQIRYMKPMRDHVNLELDGKNLLPTLEYISVEYPPYYREIISTVKAACPFFGNFVFQRTSADDSEVRWYRTENRDMLLSFRSLSCGTARFIALATLLLQPSELQPQVILIDEPELGLHPLALTLLGEMLMAASDERQLIVATQSADLVSQMQPENVIVVDRKEDKSVFSRLKTSELVDWFPDFSLGDLWKTNLFGGCF